MHLTNSFIVLYAVLVTIVIAAPASRFVERCGVNLCLFDATKNSTELFRGAGANIYWLGLDENVPPGVIAYPTQFRIADALNTSASVMGASIVRSHTLGISVGNPLSFEPALNVFNDTALAAADYAIYMTGQLGLRLQIPLTDNYHYYHGGKHTFTDWLGLDESEFYTNALAITAFKNYIYHRLSHVNIFNGLPAWADPTIMMWETGNELQAPANWTADIASYIKSIAPSQLVMDGNYGINVESLATPQVDAYSDHFYPVDVGRLAVDVQLVQAANKTFVVGEFGWNDEEVPNFLQQVLSSATAYDAYWSLFPHADNYGFVQHNDGFTLHWPGDTSAMAEGAMMLRQHAYQMANTTAPNRTPAPPAPLITNISVVSQQLYWRGAAGAGNYSIETSPAVTGPWNVICDLCVTDDSSPFHSPSIQKSQYYRIQGCTPDGSCGPFSPASAALGQAL